MTGGAPALGWERWATVWPEAEPLFQQHHDAVGSELLGHHEIDTEQAAALDAAGAMLFATGRREARLEAGRTRTEELDGRAGDERKRSTKKQSGKWTGGLV